MIQHTQPVTASAGPGTQDSGLYELHLTEGDEDAAWDAFLGETPGGYYAQASLWARVKALLGWKALRITATRHGEIVGGIQVLLRPLPVLGSIGYAARGPVLAHDDPRLAELLVAGLGRIARQRRVRMVVVQPPDPLSARCLEAAGYRPTPREVVPAYTLLLDLRPELDDLLAGMDRGTRYNIRLSGRKGVTVREGTRADVPVFHAMLRATSERQGFAISDVAYYERLWDVFEPGGHAALFVAEVEGEPVSAQLAIRFGEVAINKMTVWSGQHGKLKPNEAVLWGAIAWAKQGGCRFYDFGGLSTKAARFVFAGQPLPEKYKGSVTSFKLGFGGDIAAYPGAYLYVSHPVARWADRKVVANLETSGFAKKLLHRFRTK